MPQLIKLKKKKLILENPDGTYLDTILARDITLSLRFNSIGSITFTCDRENCESFDFITSGRTILLQNIGRYIVENPARTEDGKSESMTLTCRSFEYDINRKTIPYLNGTYKFYSLNIEEETIMSKIMSYLPNWTIDSVDINLVNLYRTFDFTDRPLLQAMQEDFATSFECIFVYDTLNYKIKVVSVENVVKNSDIYLSFENLVKNLEITEKTDELITALTVSGGNDLSIAWVNILGDTIYDFSYFTDTVTNGTKFMSDSLISAINSWENLVDSYQTSYADYLLQRKTKIAERVVLESDLVTLKSELKSLILVRDALLESGQSASSANANVIAKQNEINAKESAIATKKAEINAVENNITTIQNAVRMSTFFTVDQIKELDRFIYHQSITDENFVVNEIDTDDIIQQTAQDLYDKYKRLLSKNKDLKYEFTIAHEDFISQEQYQLFTSQLDWGVQVTLKDSKGNLSYPILLGLDIPLDDNNSEVQFLFSTEMRLKSASEDYGEYLSNTVSSMASKVNNSSLEWGLFVNSGAKSKTDDFFQNGLNLDLQEIKSATGQEITFDSTGLQGRKKESENVYSLKQWKFINNKLLFTDDNWNTAKLGIGEINLGSGGTAYGVSGEIICGQILAGSQLLIKNSSNTFSLDAESATLINAIFSVIGNNGKNKIILDPTDGFKIQKLVGETWTDVVYLDSEGNAIFSGNITASTISGSTFNAGDGNLIIDINGNITSIGDVSFGNSKLTFNKTTGLLTVKGDIEADDLFLTIDGVKTSIIDELTGKIDGQYITGGMSGTTALGNLLVDNLSTSDKIRNYLASNTAQVNYIRIYDQYIEFVEATYAGGTTQARTGDKTGDLLYWTDDTHNFVTSVTDGSLEAVMVYTYTELIKGKYGYQLVDGTNQPTITLGAGTGTGDNGKTFIYKGTDGFYIDYRNSVTGASTIFKITDSGIDLSQFTSVTYNANTTISGMIQIWVQDDTPTTAKAKDLWVDTNDYSRYDITTLTASTTLLESDNEIIRASGTISITLHSAIPAGIIKKISNIGTGNDIVTLIGTINGKSNMCLYPKESISLITNGSSWEEY